MSTCQDRCTCGHTVSQHELRTWRFGCFISGCLCIDFEPVTGPVAVSVEVVELFEDCGCPKGEAHECLTDDEYDELTS